VIIILDIDIIILVTINDLVTIAYILGTWQVKYLQHTVYVFLHYFFGDREVGDGQVH